MLISNLAIIWGRLLSYLMAYVERQQDWLAFVVAVALAVSLQ